MVKKNPQDIKVSSNPATTFSESKDLKNKSHESAKSKNQHQANQKKINSKSVIKIGSVALNPGETSAKTKNIIVDEINKEDAQTMIKQLKAKNEELTLINNEILAEYASFVQDVNSCFAEACKKVEEKSKRFINKYLNKEYIAGNPTNVPVNTDNTVSVHKLEEKEKKNQDSVKIQQSTEELLMKSDVIPVSEVSAKKIQFKVEDRVVPNKKLKTSKVKASTQIVDPKPLDSVILVEKSESVEKINEAQISNEISDEDLSPPELAAKITREYTNLLKLSC